MNAITIRNVLAIAAFAASFAAQAAPEIGAKVTIEKNKASNVMAVGGKGTAGKFLGGLGKGLELDASGGEANVNSLIVREGKVKGDVTITGNEAKDIKAIGAAANVNSVILGK